MQGKLFCLSQQCVQTKLLGLFLIVVQATKKEKYFTSIRGTVINKANNRMHSDSKKRRSFVALLFTAGDARRYAS